MLDDIEVHQITDDVRANSPYAPIIEVMRGKFLKYWEEVPIIIIMINYFHSSFKEEVHNKYALKI
jgi:hypothetical protein